MQNFHSLTREQQARAIRDMARDGFSDHGIARATRLSVEMVRRVIGAQAVT
jgi:hypothetical protein